MTARWIGAAGCRRRNQSDHAGAGPPRATGAETILEYVNAGLIDEFSIALSPVLFGSGIRLFEGVDAGRVALTYAEQIFELGDRMQEALDEADNGRVRLTVGISDSLPKLIAYRLTPEFAPANASIVDAYIDLKFHPAATVRAGKVKGPVGLERLQSGGAIGFIDDFRKLAKKQNLGLTAKEKFIMQFGTALIAAIAIAYLTQIHNAYSTTLTFPILKYDVLKEGSGPKPYQGCGGGGLKATRRASQ